MERNSSSIIIADTSGLISLFIPDDHNHAVAVTAAEQLQNEQKDIFVPAAVFVEFLNIVLLYYNIDLSFCCIGVSKRLNSSLSIFL